MSIGNFPVSNANAEKMNSMKRTDCVLILHDIRSAHNVGSMFRTADGAGISEIILSGYTPCPPTLHEGATGGLMPLYLTPAQKALKKTALGAEESVSWSKVSSLARLITRLKKDGYEIVALEQATGSVDYRRYRPKQKVALLVGNEVGGVARKTLAACDVILEIPMHGRKNSLNVSVATGIALYQIIGTMKR